jgi:uncharacterized phiE125 gp8 family phage protein
VRYIIRTVTPVADIPLLFPVDDELRDSVLKSASSVDAGLIEKQLRAATSLVEEHVRVILTEREMELVLGGFPLIPELISFPRDPVTGILSVAYTDASTGEEVVLDSADWRWADHSPDQLLPAFRRCWPRAACERGAVRIRFTAGYEDGLCPPKYEEAVRKTLLNLYDNREAAGLSDEVKKDLAPYRIRLA